MAAPSHVVRSSICIVAAVASILACQSDATGPRSPAEAPLALSVAPALATMGRGKELRLTASVHQPNGTSTTPAGVTWSSADETIASVGADGVVRSLKAGRVQIVAEWQASRGSSSIVVQSPVGDKPLPPCISAQPGGAGSNTPNTERCS